MSRSVPRRSHLRAITVAVVAITAVAVAVPVCRAQDPNLANAQAALESAYNTLQAGEYVHGGHRDKALGHIRRALEEVRRAQAEPPSGSKAERKLEKRELKLERKDEKREERLERKEQQRQQELEERNP